MIGTDFYYHNGVGVCVGDDNDNSSLLNDHILFYHDLILYVYSIILIYITLLVWLYCFINNNNNKIIAMLITIPVIHFTFSCPIDCIFIVIGNTH